MTTHTIGIAGAGLVGRILALNLVKSGHKVTLFEKDSYASENAAGLVAAGMLAPFAELETAESAIFDAGLRSIQLWPDLLTQIKIPQAFQKQGSLITAHRSDMPELMHFITQLQSKIPAAASIETLDQTGIAALEPDLAQHRKAFFLPTEAQVNAQQFMEKSTLFLQEHPSVQWKTHQVVSRVSDGQIETNETCVDFDWVFDARGLGAKPDIADLRGVRGEVFWLDAPDVSLSRPVRLMHPRYRIYIVPRPNHRYVVGATEIESEDQSDMSVRSSLELLSAVYSVHSGFGEARIVKMLTNCRPALKDNLPRILHENKTTRINGLYRHGYLLAPAVVEQALNEIPFMSDSAA
ncbi:tRNA 5-methylaminomethyl-2-thiouridine biosynthesis bifunctional protein MnmC [Hydrogenovibrio crunogenus]|uniref:D-amino-acid oxidase n=1 Tax=Hydrogenovibrio crunogenus TaxID=39765 RepID=A0A4P7NWN2_9GAMM|nr:FAD-dependent oxidoreductase [Hydrogenovibrio crunogenus]QBZ82113.1 tRNA 5-methylaminomethyl-2-thiouridine biosynthesis bifunctional protein MnmC [Hydrogenovibrio crunogenus]